MLPSASGSSSGWVEVPHDGGTAAGLIDDPLAVWLDAPRGDGPGITPSGMTWAISGSAASAVAWPAVNVAITALTRLVDDRTRPPAERMRLKTGACWARTSDSRVAELAAIPPFWLRRMAMYFWVAPAEAAAAMATAGVRVGGAAAATLEAGRTIPATRLRTAPAVNHGRRLREERRAKERGAIGTSTCAD